MPSSRSQFSGLLDLVLVVAEDDELPRSLGSVDPYFSLWS